MERRPKSLRIGGQSYKVVSSASEEDLERLAATVSAKIEEVTPPGRMAAPQAVVLAALALAHELEEERALRTRAEQRMREVLQRVLRRIDDALSDDPER